MPLLPEQIKKLRDAVKALPKDDPAIAEVSKYKGLTSIPVIVGILQDLEMITKQQTKDHFKLLTGKDLDVVASSDINVMATMFLKKDIETLVKEFIRGDLEHINAVNIKADYQAFADKITACLQESIHLDIKKIDPSQSWFSLVQDFQTAYFVNAAIRIYKHADWFQNAGDAELVGEKILGNLNEKRIRKPFLAISHGAGLVSISKETIELWRELEMWLKGFYKMTYDRLPASYKREDGTVRRENGHYPRIQNDTEDEKFHKHCGLTKGDVAEYHGLTGTAIGKIRLTLLSKPPTPEKSAAKTEKTTEKDSAVSSAQSSQSGGFSMFSNPVQKGTLVSFLKHESFVKEEITTKEKKTIKESKESDEDKIDMLVSGVLKSYALGQLERDLLAYLKDKSIATLQGYINNTYTWRWHSSKATNTKKQLSDCDSTDVLSQLIIICDMRNYLIGKSSDDLLKKVNDLLLGVYNKLVAQGTYDLKETPKMTATKS